MLKYLLKKNSSVFKCIQILQIDSGYAHIDFAAYFRDLNGVFGTCVCMHNIRHGIKIKV